MLEKPAQLFKIGEKALYVREGSKYYGTEVTVMTDLEYLKCNDKLTGESMEAWVYQVDGPSWGKPPTSAGWSAQQEWLKKIPPKKDWNKICTLDNIPEDIKNDILEEVGA
jgi:hypothetical protein